MTDNELFSIWLSIAPEQVLGPSIKRRLEKIGNAEIQEALAEVCRIENLELCVTMNTEGQFVAGLYSSEIHRFAKFMAWLTNSNPNVAARFDDQFLWISSAESPQVEETTRRIESMEVDYVAKLVVSSEAILSADLQSAPNQVFLNIIRTAALFEGAQSHQQSKLVIRSAGPNLKLNFELDKTMMRAISMLFVQSQ